MILRAAYDTYLPDNKVSIEFIAHNSKEHRELEPGPGMLFADFSVPPEKADAFLAAGALILDHHRGKDGINKDVVLRFVAADQGAFGDEETDPGICGAVLVYEHVWKAFCKPDPVVENFARLAGIRDTWQSQHPDFHLACLQAATLQFWPEEHLLEAPPSKWSRLTDKKFGQVLWDKHHDTVKKVATRLHTWVSPKGTRVCLFQGTKLTSDMAELLGEAFDLIIGFDLTKEDDQLKMLLSTRSHTNFDCAHFCGTHKGGGHTKAAGFTYILDFPQPLQTSPGRVG